MPALVEQSLFHFLSDTIQKELERDATSYTCINVKQQGNLMLESLWQVMATNSQQVCHDRGGERLFLNFSAALEFIRLLVSHSVLFPMLKSKYDFSFSESNKFHSHNLLLDNNIRTETVTTTDLEHHTHVISTLRLCL